MKFLLMLLMASNVFAVESIRFNIDDLEREREVAKVVDLSSWVRLTTPMQDGINIYAMSDIVLTLKEALQSQYRVTLAMRDAIQYPRTAKVQWFSQEELFRITMPNKKIEIRHPDQVIHFMPKERVELIQHLTQALKGASTVHLLRALEFIK